MTVLSGSVLILHWSYASPVTPGLGNCRDFYFSLCKDPLDTQHYGDKMSDQILGTMSTAGVAIIVLVILIANQKPKHAQHCRNYAKAEAPYLNPTIPGTSSVLG